eukprot:TRINITY_DN3374_c0_g1_i3.p4 TRINITY_DN3374_c0_g1~~TRINITY_DN3374_c0_g1_i3.p4  ORF type:complete len:149 (-),score=8.47 TRINITY_DN3374_c0_g1_i3:378-824(-)
MTVGRTPNKPQWRPGGSSKPASKPTYSGTPSLSTSKRKDQSLTRNQQSNSKLWRQHNDTISEVGSVACSVMTPTRQEQSPIVSEQRPTQKIHPMQEFNEDSTADSNPKDNESNEEHMQDTKRRGGEVLTRLGLLTTNNVNIYKPQETS